MLFRDKVDTFMPMCGSKNEGQFMLKRNNLLYQMRLSVIGDLPEA